MTAPYAERLLKRAELLASLIIALVEDRTYTYEKLARMAGTSKTALYYFVGVTQRKKSSTRANHTSIKLEMFSKLLSWFESVDFEQPDYSELHRNIAGQIRSTFDSGITEPAVEILADGFSFEKDKGALLDAVFSKHFLAVRRRGKSEMVSVASLEFIPSKESQYVGWDLRYLAGEKSWTRESPVGRVDQKTHKVSGYCAYQDNMLTCIGKQFGTHLIQTLTVALPESMDESTVLLASYTSFSRKEIISRPMLLIQQHDITRENVFMISDRVRDYTQAQLKKLEEELNFDGSLLGELGFSVNTTEFVPVNVSSELSNGET